MFDAKEWLTWFSSFEVERVVMDNGKVAYFYPEISKDHPIADYDERSHETRLLCSLEYALRYEIKKRKWALSLDMYPDFSAATIIEHLESYPKEIAFKRNKEDNATLKALCMAFYEAVEASHS